MSGRVSLIKGRGVLIVSLWGVDWFLVSLKVLRTESHCFSPSGIL